MTEKRPPNDNEVVCSFCGRPRKVGDGLIVKKSGVAICTTCARNVLDMFAPKSQASGLTNKGKSKSRFAHFTPSMIKAELDKRIIGQDETKKILSEIGRAHV